MYYHENQSLPILMSLSPPSALKVNGESAGSVTD